MSKKKQSKWEREVTRGFLKIPEVANVNIDSRNRKNHNHAEVALKTGTIIPVTFAKTVSDHRAIRNLISFFKREVANDNLGKSISA